MPVALPNPVVRACANPKGTDTLAGGLYPNSVGWGKDKGLVADDVIRIFATATKCYNLALVYGITL